MEWITATWARWTCTLLTLLFLIPTVLSDKPAADMAIEIAAIPFISIVIWYSILVMLLISRHLGVIGVALSAVVIVYFFMFSKFVVQSHPKIFLPLTKERSGR